MKLATAQVDVELVTNKNSMNRLKKAFNSLIQKSKQVGQSFGKMGMYLNQTIGLVTKLAQGMGKAREEAQGTLESIGMVNDLSRTLGISEARGSRLFQMMKQTGLTGEESRTVLLRTQYQMQNLYPEYAKMDFDKAFLSIMDRLQKSDSKTKNKELMAIFGAEKVKLVSDLMSGDVLEQYKQSGYLTTEESQRAEKSMSAQEVIRAKAELKRQKLLLRKGLTGGLESAVRIEEDVKTNRLRGTSSSKIESAVSSLGKLEKTADNISMLLAEGLKSIDKVTDQITGFINEMTKGNIWKAFKQLSNKGE